MRPAGGCPVPPLLSMAPPWSRGTCHGDNDLWVGVCLKLLHDLWGGLLHKPAHAGVGGITARRGVEEECALRGMACGIVAVQRHAPQQSESVCIAGHSLGEHPKPLAAAEEGVAKRRRRRSPPPPRPAGLPGLADLQAPAAARAVQPGRRGAGRAGRTRARAVLLPGAAGRTADGCRRAPARCQQHGCRRDRRQAELGFTGSRWEPWRPWRAGTSLQASCTEWAAGAGRSWPTPACDCMGAAPQQGGGLNVPPRPLADTLHGTPCTTPPGAMAGGGALPWPPPVPRSGPALHGRCRRLHAARPPLGPQHVDGRRMPPCKAGIAGPGGSQLGRLPGPLPGPLLPLGRSCHQPSHLLPPSRAAPRAGQVKPPP